MTRPATTSGATIADLGEFGLIDVIKGMMPPADSRLVLGIGDDTAAFRTSPGKLLLTTCDIQVEDRHFRREHISAHQLGRRSAAINLSDIAAMGGQPLYALVSLALPQETEVDWVRELYLGLREELGRFDAAVIGGNLSASAEGVIIDITLLGEVTEEFVLRRSGARPGDAILVTGAFGASIIGRLALERRLSRARREVARVVEAHLTPTPRMKEGLAIAAAGTATAMIDVSDGLASDLGHICDASGVGARIFADRVPIVAETRALAGELGVDVLRAALHGGEDYELILTCAPSEAATLAHRVQEETGTAVAEIGQITQGLERLLVLPGGGEEALKPAGWDHFQAGRSM